MESDEECLVAMNGWWAVNFAHSPDKRRIPVSQTPAYHMTSSIQFVRNLSKHLELLFFRTITTN